MPTPAPNPHPQDLRAVLIAGPTASGKSGVALELALRFDGTVINADSMQIYRELEVLTARPSPSEEQLAPHLLYGAVSAAEAYSVGRWLGDVAGAIEQARAEGRLPILVGGTGLYFKALSEGLAPVPDIPAEVRKHWREQADALGGAGLHAILAARDPVIAAQLRPTDPHRILRALEVIDATGMSLSEWRGGNAQPALAAGEALKLVIAPEREPLYAGIDTRFDLMLERGALEEVRRLLDLGLDPGLPAMRAHGVRELGAYLAGVASLDQAVAKAKTETRRYAKRQMTWARRYMADWEWFPDPDPAIAAGVAVLAIR
ncbi:MAG: tRNA (adenosine(37)-N6)-dimethylallyltransferase MiaA [Methyloceanibacter sp.]